MTWDHMDVKMALYIHNVEHEILKENLDGIIAFLTIFTNGTEALDAVGDIICFLLVKLAKG